MFEPASHRELVVVRCRVTKLGPARCSPYLLPSRISIGTSPIPAVYQTDLRRFNDLAFGVVKVSAVADEAPLYRSIIAR